MGTKAQCEQQERAPADTSCISHLNVTFEDSPYTNTILFDRPPEVLFTKGQPLSRRDKRTTYKREDGHAVVIEGLGRKPEAIWLYFHEGILQALLMYDDLPAALNSYDSCRRVWPIEVRTNAYGVVLLVRLSNGEMVQRGFDTVYTQFNPALRNTGSFFQPLDDLRDAISSEQERSIKEIAQREYSLRHKDGELEAPESNRNDSDQKSAHASEKKPDVLVKNGRFIQHWHNGKMREQILTPTEHKLVVYCAQHYRDKKHFTGFYFPDLCAELELRKDVISEKGNTPSHIFWKDAARKKKGGYPVFPLFFRPKRDAESRGLYEYIGPPLTSSTPRT